MSKKTRLVEQPVVLIRHSTPNMYDQAIKGTRCKVVASDGSEAWYEQQSSDENTPKWETIEIPSC